MNVLFSTLFKLQVVKEKQMKHIEIKSSYCIQLKNLIRRILDDLQIQQQKASIRQIRPTDLFSIQLVLIIFSHCKYFPKYFLIEFPKDSSTKLMCIVLANPRNFDNRTLQVKKLHKSKTIKSVRKIKFSSRYS